MRLAFILALKDMRGPLAGFRIFFACLALGTGALAGVGSFAQSLYAGMAREGRAILGGDVEIRLPHQPAPEEARAFFAQSAAKLSEVRQMNAMALYGDDNLFVSLKSVDGFYPLAGRMETKPDKALAALLAAREGLGGSKRFGALYDPAVARLLGAKQGDTLRIGEAEFYFSAAILSEPDRLSDNVLFAPRIMISQEALGATGLVQPGSLLAYHYRIELSPAAALNPLGFTEALKERFPEAGWRIRDRNNSSPQIRRFIERFGFLLTLGALTALIIGGIGVSNAVAAHLQSRLRRIASFKCLGASAQQVFQIYLFQILILATGGILLGLFLGASVPYLVQGLASDILPVPLVADIYPLPLFMSALYGWICALLFSIWPLAAARDVPPASLFRAHIEPAKAWPSLPIQCFSLFLLLLLLLLAFFSAPEGRYALYFLLGCAAAILTLYSLSAFLLFSVKRLPQPQHWLWHIVRSTLIRPGGASARIILALSLGLALLAAVALVDGNVQNQLRSELPSRAPSFFLMDVRQDQRAALEEILRAEKSVSDLLLMPMIRGRVTHLNGIPADKAPIDPQSAWVLRGDRGLTYAEAVPENNAILEGAWWSPDYEGVPLISLEEEIARDLRLRVGDSMDINVLGRRIRTKIANIREVRWEEMGINFAIILSPNALQSAPHNFIGTFAIPENAEDRLRQSLVKRFPNIVLIPVRDALRAVRGILENISIAARAASALTLLTGILVLAGAMAAGYRQKLHEALIFKILGASRRRILLTSLVEYALLGLIASLSALLIGTIAAYMTITQIMGADWVFLPIPLIATTFLACILTIGLGVGTQYHLLRQRVAPLLQQMSN